MSSLPKDLLMFGITQKSQLLMNGFYYKSCGYQSVNKYNTYYMCVFVNKYAFEESHKSCSRDQDLCSVLGPGTKSYRQGHLNSSHFSTTFR